MRGLLLLAIRSYQRFLSPHKGFRCAYHVDTGCASCSELGRRAVRRYGVGKGLSVLNGRFGKCAQSSRRLHAQAGFCELLAVPEAVLSCFFDGALWHQEKKTKDKPPPPHKADE